MEKCGHLNMHWYHDGDTCTCGQVPADIFFSANCTCGQSQKKYPIHASDCAFVRWVDKRNKFVAANLDIRPRLKLVHAVHK